MLRKLAIKVWAIVWDCENYCDNASWEKAWVFWHFLPLSCFKRWVVWVTPGRGAHHFSLFFAIFLSNYFNWNLLLSCASLFLWWPPVNTATHSIPDNMLIYIFFSGMFLLLKINFQKQQKNTTSQLPKWYIFFKYEGTRASVCSASYVCRVNVTPQGTLLSLPVTWNYHNT